TRRRPAARSPSNPCAAASSSSSRPRTSRRGSRRFRAERRNTMAAYDLQEQDQIDDLKAWWTRWGGTISTGLLLGALVVVGIQGWRWYTGTRAAEASTLY